MDGEKEESFSEHYDVPNDVEEVRQRREPVDTNYSPTHTIVAPVACFVSATLACFVEGLFIVVFISFEGFGERRGQVGRGGRRLIHDPWTPGRRRA